MVAASRGGRPRNAAVSRARLSPPDDAPISARVGSQTPVALRTAQVTRVRAVVVALVVARCCMPLARAAPVVDPDMGVVAELAVAWSGTAACNTWVCGRDCDTMAGLLCDAQGHAVAIDVQGVSIVPARITQLEHLTSLSITSSSLDKGVPPTILAMPTLKHLNLTGCRISVPLSSFVSQNIPSALETLKLAGNFFRDNSTDALARITSLRHLDLSYNSLSGPLLDAFSALHHLTALHINSNFFEGLPTVLTTLTALKHLSMGANGFKPAIPPLLGDMSNLQMLSCVYCFVNGPLPSELSRLKKLTHWGLSYTGVWGTLPSSLGNLANLETLWLPRNNLSWTIPNSFSRLNRLSTLELSENRLSGPIPSILGRLTNLDKMTLHGNRLAGIIPASLGRLSRLTFMDLSYNRIRGTIPAALSGLSSIDDLNLAGNRLTGTIPAAFSALSSLKNLNLKSNELVGSVPSLQRMKSVRNIFAGYNFLTATADASLANIHSLCTAGGLRLYLESNCLGNTSVLCGSGQTQRSSSECESLCGSSPDIPYCSGHGVCYRVFEQIGRPQCACYEGYTAGTDVGTCVPQVPQKQG
ncbi:unnamed protein product [Closterium sp. Naga37s-1]|nr:unnamed protein product [Closterium sp. Naga37s-1]